MTLFDVGGKKTERSGSGMRLSTRATLGVTVMLTAGIGGTAAAGLWISIRGLERQAVDASIEQAVSAGRRIETLTRASATNVANALDIVLEEHLRAQAAATAMLVEAAEAAGRGPDYIEDALRQITLRSPMRRIDVVARTGERYSTDPEGLAWNELEPEIRATEDQATGATAAAPSVYGEDGLTKAAAARMYGDARAVRIEQALDGIEAAAAYGGENDRTARALADRQAGAIAQLLTHAIELAEDAGWGADAIARRLGRMVADTAVESVSATAAGGGTVYEAPAGADTGDGAAAEDDGQGVTVLPGHYGAGREWISRARATRANGRLAVTVRLATRAGEGSLAETAWQVEANRIWRGERVTGVWIGRAEEGGLRLAAAAPRAGDTDGTGAWARWEETAAFAADTAAGTEAATRASMEIVGGTGTVVTAAPSSRGTVVVIESQAGDVLDEMRRETLASLGAAGTLVLLLGWVTTAIARRSLTRPVESIARAAERLEEGERPPPELTAHLRRRTDEIGSLATSFDKMGARVLARHDELETLVGERTRRLESANRGLQEAKKQVEQEIQLARRVQESLAPPANECHGRLTIAVRMTPAREIGGDFVVTRRQRDGRILIAVCDVSGKGVAAGLFMASARAAIEAGAEREEQPAAIAAYANDRLSTGNTLAMFVTGFIAVLDPETGEMEYACAGHEAPIRVRRRRRQQALEGTGDPPLALMENHAFETRRHRIEGGESIVAYTDGVTDACDADDAEFGKEGLAGVLRSAGGEEPEKTINRLWGSIRAFAGDTPATDDKTVAIARLATKAER